VSPKVLEGLEAMRESGQTNMMDYLTVQITVSRMGYSETVQWLKEHKREYIEDIYFAGLWLPSRRTCSMIAFKEAIYSHLRKVLEHFK
jgi:Domain of unknown function (DUF5049)